MDRLVVKELIGPWLFGVALFSALLIAATYLGRIAEYVVKGVPAATVGQVTALLLPAVLVQTFPMSMLLSALLGFGRLSSDSEIVALRAAGVSLPRILWPVLLFALVVSGIAFASNENIVPAAAKQSEAIMMALARNNDTRSSDPVSFTQFDKGRLVAMIQAQNASLGARTLSGVTIVTYESDGAPSLIMFADELEYRGEDDWRIRGNAKMISADLKTKVDLTGGAWPSSLPKITTSPQDILAKNLKAFDSLSMAEIRERISSGIANKTLKPKEVRNFEYGYWNKIALPLAAVVFGVLGGALGIRSHRTSTAAGFALAVAIIFGYFMIANFMNVWALNGVLPPYVASFAPLVVGTVAAGIIIWRKNG